MSFALYSVYDINGTPITDGAPCVFAFSTGCLKRATAEDVKPINGTLKVYLKSTKTDDGMWVDPAGVLRLEEQAQP